jgi:hypothetical protein
MHIFGNGNKSNTHVVVGSAIFGLSVVGGRGNTRWTLNETPGAAECDTPVAVERTPLVRRPARKEAQGGGHGELRKWEEGSRQMNSGGRRGPASGR